MASPHLKKTEALMEKLIPDLSLQERAVLLAKNEHEHFLSPEEIKLAVKFDTPNDTKEFLRILSLHTKGKAYLDSLFFTVSQIVQKETAILSALYFQIMSDTYFCQMQNAAIDEYIEAMSASMRIVIDEEKDDALEIRFTDEVAEIMRNGVQSIEFWFTTLQTIYAAMKLLKDEIDIDTNLEHIADVIHGIKAILTRHNKLIFTLLRNWEQYESDMPVRFIGLDDYVIRPQKPDEEEVKQLFDDTGGAQGGV